VRVTLLIYTWLLMCLSHCHCWSCRCDQENSKHAVIVNSLLFMQCECIQNKYQKVIWQKAVSPSCHLLWRWMDLSHLESNLHCPILTPANDILIGSAAFVQLTLAWASS